jgi:hypothetical protein
MYRAAYRQFPDHTFTIDMGRTRTLPPVIPRSLSNDILSRINSFRVTWNVDKYNNGALLRPAAPHHFLRSRRSFAKVQNTAQAPLRRPLLAWAAKC